VPGLSWHGLPWNGLSRSQANRSISAFGTKTFWKGFQVGCYTCHSGPGSENKSSNHAPIIANASTSTPPNTPVAIALKATDPDGNPMTLRIVFAGESRHGRFGRYRRDLLSEDGYLGGDSFTFAANDGQTDSNWARSP